MVLVGLSDEIIQQAYPVPSIKYGPTWNDETLSVDPDGTEHHRLTSIPYERIPYNGEYSNYLFTDTGSALIVETMRGSITLDKSTCGFSFHNKGRIYENPTPLFSDSIVPYSKTVDLANWSVVTQIDAAVCTASWNGSELTATKTAPGIGTIQYKYILQNNSWKTQLEATNLTGLTNKVFGFDQTIDLNRDVVWFGGNMRNLDNYAGQTFEKSFITNNEDNIIDFMNGYNFDLSIGFEYLDSISVIDSGTDSSQLVFHFMDNNEILLTDETLIIDPTYSSNNPTVDGEIISNAISGTSCGLTGTTKNTAGTAMNMYVGLSGSSIGCYRSFAEYDVTTIPDSAIISSVEFEYDTTTSTTTKSCAFVGMTIQPSVGSTDDIYDNILDADELAVSASCNPAGNNKIASLGSNGTTYVKSQLPSDWVSIGMRFDDETRDAVQSHTTTIATEEDGTATPKPTLTIEYSVPVPPDPVDDLTLVAETFGTVVMSWTEPNLNSGNLSGYQINYSTPFGDPLTIITNDTKSSDTSTTVTGLSVGTGYSFRVSAWTEGGNNATGNILNVTTSGNFTIGTAVFNQTNNEVLPITFETQTINDTAIFLNVTFSNAFDLACDFNYKYAIINQTYKNLDSYAVSTTLNETSFLFNNVTNEIIGVDCWDYNTGTDADTVLTISDFPLLTQIQDFRNGEFGTMGKIGVFDVVTLFVVIISMIGLNRVNESVGIVFNVALLGSLAWFEIIELPTVIFGVLALVMVFVITSTRKG